MKEQLTQILRRIKALKNNTWPASFRLKPQHALLFLTFMSLSFAVYFYMQFNALQENSAEEAQTEAAALVAKVSQLIVLPDESPTIATVTDPEVLKAQAFFALAQTGFKVLIYTNARKAILYDPGAHRIIEVAPINTGGVPEISR